MASSFPASVRSVVFRYRLDIPRRSFSHVHKYGCTDHLVSINRTSDIMTQQARPWLGLNKAAGCAWSQLAGVRSAADRNHNLSPATSRTVVQFSLSWPPPPPPPPLASLHQSFQQPSLHHPISWIMCAALPLNVSSSLSAVLLRFTLDLWHFLLDKQTQLKAAVWG